MNADEMVAKGAAVLDSAQPGWVNLVDTEELDIQSTEDCILGQVFGDYIFGLQYLQEVTGLLFETGDPATRRELQSSHGFDATYGIGPDLWEEMESLAVAWIRLINARRA